MLILVTGATGNVGRHVVNRLLEAGVQVRALTRSPDKANLALHNRGCSRGRKPPASRSDRAM